MQYHVAKNGEKAGPLDKEEVYRRLVAGDLSGTDLGWHEGLAEWAPLSKLLPPPQAQPVFATSAPHTMAPAIPQSTSGLAIASLVCGILGFVTLGLAGLPAVITGHLGLSAIKKSGGALGGRGLAIAGLVMGYLGFALIGVAVLAAMAVPVFTSVQEKAYQAKAMNNARQLIVGLKQYANDHDGVLPPSLEELYAEKILADRQLLEYPGPRSLPDHSQAWEYRGAGVKDSSNSTAIVLISLKTHLRKKQIVAHLNGLVEIAKE